MFRAVQRDAGGAGIVAPFPIAASQSSRARAPRTHSSARQSKYKQQTTLGSFRDDTRLVALRYDQTVALEPPIPLPPPRSPLRPAPRTSSFDMGPKSNRDAPIVVPPPVPPPCRPAPPAEQHPALRTISNTRPMNDDTRRDSVHTSAASLSSRSYGSYTYTHYMGDSDEDNDPFAYERINEVHRVRPLQLRASSPTGSSVYSLHEQEGELSPTQTEGDFSRHEQERERGRGRRDGGGSGRAEERGIAKDNEGERESERRNERVSEASSRPSDVSLSPALSISSTATPTLPASPATPPPQFSRRFIRSLSLRSGSHKVSSPSAPSAKRLRKKSLATDGDGKGEGPIGTMGEITSGIVSGIVSGNRRGSGGSGIRSGNTSANMNQKRGSGNWDGNRSQQVEKKKGSDTSAGTGSGTAAALPGLAVRVGNSPTASGSGSGNSSGRSRAASAASGSSGAVIAVPSRSSLPSISSPLSGTLPLSRSQSAAQSQSNKLTNPIHPTNDPNTNNNNASLSSTRAGPASPIISTDTPCESFFEDDDLSNPSFSIRGSLIFGVKRHWKTGGSAHHKMADKDVIPETNTITKTNTNTTTTTTTTGAIFKPRAFPLVPTTSRTDYAGPAPTRPPRDDDMGVAALIQKPFHPPESSHLYRPPKGELANDTASTYKVPPSIRVISAEAEKESQKVRSLYESEEVLQLGDGDVPWPHGGTPEHSPEVPSGVGGNDALSDRIRGRRTQRSATTSSPARPGSRQLAGGLEDWEGVQGQDVDRYGFIIPRQPDPGSPPGTATTTGSSPIQFSARKQRNVLSRKDATARSLGAKRPARKMSARSLNTHNSELSTVSHRSVRSTIRQATNRLPHNRDRRLIDEAGDLLALEPGITYVAEYDGAKMAADMKRKEVKRTEKWRKMAKTLRPGSEGQGTLFHFDVKNPKLIERTWKGIPDCWRSAAWYSFLASSAKSDPINYVSDEELTAAFHHFIEEPSPDDTQIDLDVPRTINQHIMFRKRYRGGQRLLFRVLHALSLYFPETGYVQGMAPLAATLLSYYDEERCFIMLVRLWQFRGLNRIYQSGFVELIEALKDFETYWLNDKDVAAMLRELCIDPTAYATRWYLTLFNLSIPFPVQLRVWDVFMLLGSSPPDQQDSNLGTGKEVDAYPSSKGLEILHATSLAIIDTLHASLIDSDFENAMKSLTSWVPIKDEQKFLEVVRIEWKKHQSKEKKRA